MPKDGRPSLRELAPQRRASELCAKERRANHPQEFAKQLRHEVHKAAKARSKMAKAAHLVERKEKDEGEV